MPLSKVNKEIMQTKPSSHVISSVAVEISSPRKIFGVRGGLKLAGGGDCE
jgi:hypothetical protein